MNDSPETSEQRAERMRLAERAFDNSAASRKVTSEQILSFSNAAMRAPALVAAGGVAALLGFYSANYSRLHESSASLQIFNDVLFWLFAGLLMTVMAPGLAYFSQLAYYEGLAAEKHSYVYPYVTPSRKTKIMNAIGDFCRILATLIVVASIGSVAYGGYRFLELIPK
ncbi:hypothetical protein EV217_2858 [Phyllobacterium myrsinacearum]|uniref:hypothetical protein n=1 Tax=Phyllobacterium myrsinacearum TaxID=28101 RepID=UPI001029BDA3|nr:hypothetical protein [Phyllobacterium myrsinacearum]RZS82045.1 hypothetical protein EV217_2858 [Phyllobacterium myrsinacearum]